MCEEDSEEECEDVEEEYSMCEEDSEDSDFWLWFWVCITFWYHMHCVGAEVPFREFYNW